ncbi:hypothetical protein, partial [Phenylobacterium sp.]|uniref:hypothetical protein n=1 Tax=Phenylobacterium sp. TaxID=1871053 RepID=UPI0037CBD1E6
MPKPKPVQRERPSVFDRLGALPLPSKPDERRSFAKWPPEIPESQRGTDIFIGGFGDDKDTDFTGALRQYKDAYALGSGLIDHSQKMTVAARAMADMKVCAHRSYRV